MGGNNDLEFEPAEGDGDLPRVERDLERLPLHEQTPVRTKEEAGVEEKLETEVEDELPWSRVPDVEENVTRCNCPGCPSSPDDGMTLYCARGLSPLRVRTVGCICTSCPIYRSYALRDGYFCAVKPQRWNELRNPHRR